MTKKLLLCFKVLVCCAFTSLSAQEPDVEFGKINREKVEMSTYEADSSAEAVILYDKAVVRFEPTVSNRRSTFQINQTRHQRIKILKPSALSRGIIKLLFYWSGEYDTKQIIRNVKGFIYNVSDNSVVKEKLSRKDVIDEKAESGYYVKQISFPDVKVGSVIDLEYIIETPFNLSYNPRTWYFQHDIPTVWSEYDITIPNSLFYQMIFGGYEPLHINNKKEVNTILGVGTNSVEAINYRFVVKDAPAFKGEPYITTEDDYYSKIEFELSKYSFPGGSKSFNTTWEELDNTLRTHKNFGLRLNHSNVLKDEVKAFMAIKDTDERAKAIYKYMTSNYKWSEYNALWASDDIRKVYNDKQGSSAELNLLMIALLNDCKIAAHPVILSTRSNGKILPAYPLINKFNYVVAAVENGKDYTFLDATDPEIPFGGLPERCLNGTGRLIRMKGKSEFIPIKTMMEYTQIETIKAKLDVESGAMSASYKASTGGYLSHDMREKFKDYEPETIAEEIQKQNPDWELSDLELANEDTRSKPFEISYKIVQEGVANPGIIYLDPMLQAKIKENPFKSKTRNFPVDFGHRTMMTYMGEFEIPEGYEIDEQPESTMIALPNKGGRFIYNVSVNGNTIKVMSQVRLAKPLYYTEEYPFLKEFYGQIVQKHAEPIVLKEK